ncbi:MAG: chloride channel protein [Flavobacterium sp.]
MSIVIGFLAAFLGLILKHITEHYEHLLFGQSQKNWIFLLFFPIFSLSIISILRTYLFKKKENKGIKEIFITIRSRKKNLPSYKIPSHVINGFLTVIFGGSTGIEVSTVVAAATIGSVAQQKENLFARYKTSLICAGVAAGITALFCSPIAGVLFAYEVISKKLSRSFVIACSISVAIASILLIILDEPTMFPLTIDNWNYSAIPFFILLGILAGGISVYFTKTVMFCKEKFALLKQDYYRIILGAVLLSIALLFVPQLYGDGYHAIRVALLDSNSQLTFTFIFGTVILMILKPIITSITLAAGGDGGVFAPSLFVGAFLGLLTSVVLNSFSGVNVIVLNFVVLGMAAVLSASIHAPYTSIFLLCGVIGDYSLLIPLAIVCITAKYTAKAIYPFTVYTFDPQKV